jgi:hypothetical protein
VWGNGSDFDNAILSCLYGALGSDTTVGLLEQPLLPDPEEPRVRAEAEA